MSDAPPPGPPEEPPAPPPAGAGETAPEPPRRGFRRFAKLWGSALFLVVVAVVFREVLLPFVFAVLVAYILAPVVRRMSSWRVAGQSMPRGFAVLSCYLVVIATLAVFFSAFLPRLAGDFTRLAKEAPGLWHRLNEEWTPAAARWMERHFPTVLDKGEIEDKKAPVVGPVTSLPPPPGTVVTVTPMASGDYAVAVPPSGVEIQQLSGGRMVIKPRTPKSEPGFETVIRQKLKGAVAGLQGEVTALIRFGQSVIAGIISLIMKLVLALMVAAFILSDMERIHAFARSVIPARYRDDYDHIVAGIDKGLNGVIRGQLLICVINGVLTYLGLLLLGVKYSLLLAAIAGVLSVIPIFGTILSTLPIVLVALVSTNHGIDFVKGVLILAWILGVHFIEANLLSPKIIGTAARMHPVVVIFALIAGEHAGGVVGALLAVPAASIIQTLFLYFRHRAWKAEGQVAVS